MYDPTIPLLATYPKELKIHGPRKMCTQMFIATFFTIAKKGKQPKFPSSGESINEMWYVHTMEYWGFPYSSIRKESACNAGDLGSIPGLGRPSGDIKK